MQESTLRMYWNPKVPGSEALAPDKAAKGTDHYSVGLFQQQVNGTKFSWGTVAEAMDPAKSTGMFLTRLATIAGWEDLELGVAAQKVQISAVPTAYAKWEGLAETVVTASTPEGTVWGSGAGGSDGGADSTEGGECKPLGNPDVGEGIPVTGEFVWPVKAGKPGPPFGWRLHPIGKKWKIHYGVDVALPGGTPIYAASSGTVKDVRFWGTYGNWVEIQHANGISSGYAHIMNGGTLVTKGQHVDAGQMIAKVGTTGGSTGNHLHFEIIQTDQGNRRIDPEAFYQGRIVTDKDIKRPGA
jgi:murein DD-endopeptidase MepM/ murein hydrolase activator NlpD